MKLEDIRSAIMATLSSNWGATTVVDYPNQKFTAPADAAWIRPTIKFGDSFVGELGDDGLGMRTGVLMISIFVPPGTGIKTANGYSHTLETIFRRADVGGVFFEEPSTDYVGVDDGNGFYHLLMSCSFWTWIGE